MDNSAPVNPIHNVKFTTCRACALATNLHREQDEDCIFAGVLSSAWPCIIVADGMTNVEDRATGEVATGFGGAVAKRAVQVAQDHLGAKLSDVHSVEEVLHALRDMYDAVVRSLAEENMSGATTLLVALLWESQNDDTLFWCYAYEGDGVITVLSPTRKIDGLVVPELLLVSEMLSPQKVLRTAGIDRNGTTVSPVIGARLYEPRDLIFVASDGIIPLDGWLREVHNETFPYFLLSALQKPEPETLTNILSSCPEYTDDAVLGIIRTEVQHDRSDR